MRSDATGHTYDRQMARWSEMRPTERKRTSIAIFMVVLMLVPAIGGLVVLLQAIL